MDLFLMKVVLIYLLCYFFVKYIKQSQKKDFIERKKKDSD